MSPAVGVGRVEMNRLTKLVRQVYDIRVVVNIDHIPKLYEEEENQAQSCFTR